MRIKLINLNVWFGGRLWDNIVEYLQAEQPDILMLQEAYANAQGGEPRMNTVASIQKHLDLPHTEFETQFILQQNNETASWGNAILGRFPLSNKRVCWLQGQGSILVNGEDLKQRSAAPRNLLHCQMSLQDKVYNLMTLQGIWAPDEKVIPGQREMARLIVDYIQRQENIILTGDFNVNEETEPIKLIDQQLTNIFHGERTSSFNMKQKTKPGYATGIVDFIFTSTDIKVIDHYTAPHDVSDHQSQVVVLDL